MELGEITREFRQSCPVPLSVTMEVSASAFVHCLHAPKMSTCNAARATELDFNFVSSCSIISHLDRHLWLIVLILPRL